MPTAKSITHPSFGLRSHWQFPGDLRTFHLYNHFAVNVVTKTFSWHIGLSWWLVPDRLNVRWGCWLEWQASPWPQHRQNEGQICWSKKLAKKLPFFESLDTNFFIHMPWCGIVGPVGRVNCRLCEMLMAEGGWASADKIFLPQMTSQHPSLTTSPYSVSTVFYQVVPSFFSWFFPADPVSVWGHLPHRFSQGILSGTTHGAPRFPPQPSHGGRRKWDS